MSRMCFLRLDRAAQWLSEIEQTFLYDFYHLPAYHRLAEEQQEGEAHLFVYQDGDLFVAFPLLLRPIEQVPGFEKIGMCLLDATSVYGYAGPVASHERLPSWFLTDFIDSFKDTLLEMNVVSVFARLHPLIRNHMWLYGAGEIIGMGETVSIDLNGNVVAQWAQFRKGHRYEIRRARREGLVAYRDVHWSAYDAFIELYSETMMRTGASQRYFFSRGYFDRLRKALGGNIHLFVAEKDGEICSAALFVEMNGIVQYHLSGSHLSCLKLAPSKLVLDEARIWANQIGAHCLHLGGGVGSSNDGLYRFKAGFSQKRQRFYVWNWIVNERQYDDLVQQSLWNTQRNKLDDQAFFPSYRRKPSS